MTAMKSSEQRTKWPDIGQRRQLALLNTVRSLEKCRKQITQCEAKIAEMEKKSQELSQAVLVQGPVRSGSLTQALTGLEGAKLSLGVFQKQAASLERDIYRMSHPTDAEKERRKKGLRLLALLASTLLDNERQARLVVRTLQKLLGDRKEIQAKMLDASRLADFTPPAEGFGNPYFEDLLNTPQSLLAEASESWAAWLLGSAEGANPYRVCDETLTLPETLTRAHVYRLGDTIMLTPEQADAILSKYPNEPSIIALRVDRAASAPVAELAVSAQV